MGEFVKQAGGFYAPMKAAEFSEFVARELTSLSRRQSALTQNVDCQPVTGLRESFVVCPQRSTIVVLSAG